MSPIIPSSQQFDQSTLGKLIDADPVVQRYRTLSPSSTGRPWSPPPSPRVIF